MKKSGLLLVLLTFLCGTVFAADSNWNVESGNWYDDENWSGGKPVLSDTSGYINIKKSSTSVCTLNTDEGLFSKRWIMQNGQTLNIEDGGSFGATWSRCGRGSASFVNLTGSGTFIMNNDDLYLGLENGSMEWKMYDSSTLSVQGDDGDDSDELYLGEDGGTCLFQLNGSSITVNVDRVHVTANSAGGSATVGYVMDAAGASPIVTQRLYIGEAGTAYLNVSAAEELAQQDIVLIEVTSSYSIGGNGVFDALNDGPADEGSLILLGGNLYSLTYSYNASDSYNNDVALVFVRAAKNMANTPDPYDGEVLSSSPLTLSWTNPDPNDGSSDIVCTVYLGTSEDRSAMESVTLAPNVTTVDINEDNFPTCGIQPLPDANDYYWYVSCEDASPGFDSESGIGLTWTFSTDYNFPPVVDAGADQVIWGLPNVISLEGVITDDNKPAGASITVEWSQVSGPEVTIDSPDQIEATVSVTEAGIYEFMLSADDSDKQASDTVEVIVGSDSCEASYLSGTPYNTYDFNQDCVVDVLDFVDFAENWLNCTNTEEGCN